MAEPEEPTDRATIEAYYLEERKFPPPEGFKDKAHVTDTAMYDEADRDYEGFWARQAADLLDWDRDWDTILDWQLPFAKWFVGGTLNAAANCLDRHVAAGRGDKVAYHWEGEPGDTRTITYAELTAEVCRFANVLKSLGVQRGDRVNIYLPMIPELPVAMLACARIGAAHSVVFGGFSADALRDRINDAEAKVLVTADGGWRRAAAVPLKANADAALEGTPTIEHVVVVRRTEAEVTMVEGRDQWYHDLMADQSGRLPGRAHGLRAAPLPALHVGDDGQAQGHHAHHRRLPDPGRLHPQVRLRPPPRVRRLLVRGRHRVGHRPQLHRLRAPGQRGHVGHVRGQPRHAGQGPVVVDHRALRGDDPLHRPDGHPDVHEVGNRAPRGPRPVVAAGARVGGRAHQSRGLDVVPGARRRRSVPGGRHLVADGDRRHHDLAPARRHHHQAGFGHLPPAGDRGRGGRREGQPGRARRWLPDPHPSLAGHAAGDLRRPRALPADVLVALRGPLLRRRRGQARRRRLPVAARAGRRRDERVRPPGVDHRGGVGPGRPPDGGRGGGGGGQGRDPRAGDHRLRHPQDGRRGHPRARRGVAQARRHQDRPHRPAQDGDLHRRPAQDPQRQDHAPAPARRGRGPRPGRHHHPGRRRRGRGDQAAGGRRRRPSRSSGPAGGRRHPVPLGVAGGRRSVPGRR